MSKTEKTKSSTQHTRELDLYANRNEQRHTVLTSQFARAHQNITLQFQPNKFVYLRKLLFTVHGVSFSLLRRYFYNKDIICPINSVTPPRRPLVGRPNGSTWPHPQITVPDHQAEDDKIPQNQTRGGVKDGHTGCKNPRPGTTHTRGKSCSGIHPKKIERHNNPLATNVQTRALSLVTGCARELKLGLKLYPSGGQNGRTPISQRIHTQNPV